MIRSSAPTWMIFGAIVFLIAVCRLYFGFESEKDYYPTIEESRNLLILDDPFPSERGFVGEIDSATVSLLQIDSCQKIGIYNRFIDTVLDMDAQKKEFGIRKTVFTIEGQPIYEWMIEKKDSILLVIDSRKDRFSKDKKIERIRISNLKEKTFAVRQCPENNLKSLSLISPETENLFW